MKKATPSEWMMRVGVVVIIFIFIISIKKTIEQITPHIIEGVEYVSENGLKPIFDRIWEGENK